MDSFGYTNSDAEYQEVIAWREAALADGWTIEPISTESIETWGRIRNGEFLGHVLARRNVGKWKYHAQVSLWGPDDLAIDPLRVYDWPQIEAGIRMCLACGKKDVDTQRVGFAGRCCADCLPEQQKKHEYPGWTR